MITWLSARQAAKKLKKHHTTVYRMAKAGKIPAQIKTVEVIRIPWDDKKNKIMSM